MINPNGKSVLRSNLITHASSFWDWRIKPWLGRPTVDTHDNTSFFLWVQEVFKDLRTVWVRKRHKESIFSLKFSPPNANTKENISIWVSETKIGRQERYRPEMIFWSTEANAEQKSFFLSTDSLLFVVQIVRGCDPPVCHCGPMGRDNLNFTVLIGAVWQTVSIALISFKSGNFFYLVQLNKYIIWRSCFLFSAFKSELNVRLVLYYCNPSGYVFRWELQKCSLTAVQKSWLKRNKFFIFQSFVQCFATGEFSWIVKLRRCFYKNLI